MWAAQARRIATPTPHPSPQGGGERTERAGLFCIKLNKHALGLGVKRIELVFRQRPVSQPELYRNIVKPAGREAAIEMPHSRNDHSDDRDLDVGPRLIKNEEVEALLLGDAHTSIHLLVHIKAAKLRAEV